MKWTIIELKWTGIGCLPNLEMKMHFQFLFHELERIFENDLFSTFSYEKIIVFTID